MECQKGEKKIIITGQKVHNASLTQEYILQSTVFHKTSIKYATAKPDSIITNVKRKLKKTMRFICPLANGFLHNASTLLPETLPKEENPITKLIPDTNAAKIYLKEMSGEKKLESRPAFNAVKMLVEFVSL